MIIMHAIVQSDRTPNQSAAANPAIASLLQSTRLVRRVAELGSLAIQVSTAMTCYFQGCKEKGVTKEHIPPRSFFPEGEKEQLLTVKSCKKHNNAKSKDDLYVLAQICMNASPSNRAREVSLNKVAPQLEFNNGALRKRLADGWGSSTRQWRGQVQG